MLTITRRLFLKFSLLLAATRSFGKTSDSRRPEDLIVEIIKYRAPYLECPQKDLHDFAAVFVLQNDLSYLSNDDLGKMQELLKNTGMTSLFSNDVVIKLARLEIPVVTDFLLSTDFFYKPHAIRTPVSFVVYRTPINLGCDNPFARFD